MTDATPQPPARRIVVSRGPDPQVIAIYGAIIVSAIAMVGFFGVLVLAMFRPITINEGIRDVVISAIGTLIAGYGTAIGFWLGTSMGSHLKDPPSRPAPPSVPNPPAQGA